MKDLQHQLDAKAHLAKWKVGALFMDAGTGKTKVAIDIVNSSPCNAVFWFAPLSTIRLNNIQAEVEKQGGFKIPARYVGIESIGQSDRIYLNVVEEIKKYKKPFIVVDESLKIKNAEAKRTKKLLEIGKLAEYKLILNDTPQDKKHPYTVVDGFHRTTVIQHDKDIRESLHGYVPVSRLNKSLEDRITSTVRHNMARGTHQVELSAKLVVLLKKHNWTNARIGLELGMDADEVLRLKQITGIAEAFKDEEFSKSWIAEVNEE